MPPGLFPSPADRANPAPLPPLLIGSIGTLLLMNVYAPQSLLPLLAHEFGVSVAQVGTVIGATTLAMALFAPFSGLLADAFGRRRMILFAFAFLVVPSLLAALTHSFTLLNVVRFTQGFFVPLGLVSVTAYLADEVPPANFSRLLTAYISGTVLGGFLGRFMSGLVAHQGHWQLAFLVLAVTNALGLWVTSRLPHESHFTPQRDPRLALSTLQKHLRNPHLLLVCAVGFLILFVLVSIFNTVTFHLASAPYRLGTGPLGLIFAVYLLGVVVTPAVSPLLTRRGPGTVLQLAVATCLVGLALTLTRPLAVIVLGLAVASSGVFMAQAAAQAAIQRSVEDGRSLANGLYNLAYYGGAAVASVAAGTVYEWRQWPAVTVMCAVAMLMAAGLGALALRLPRPVR